MEQLLKVARPTTARIFRIAPAGLLTTLVQFTGIEGDNLGSAGTAALVQGSDGNFYGTTEFGVDDDGTVFKMTPGEL